MFTFVTREDRLFHRKSIKLYKSNGCIYCAMLTEQTIYMSYIRLYCDKMSFDLSRRKKMNCSIVTVNIELLIVNVFSELFNHLYISRRNK